MKRWKVRMWQGIAKRLPKPLVYFTAIQLVAEVSTRGDFRFRPVSRIEAMDAIAYYAKRHGVEK